MQDIIQKIIEIDHMAQKMTDDALALKSEAEAYIENDKKAMREKYIEKAHDRIKLTAETEQSFLTEALDDINKKYAAVSQKLDRVYESEHDRWVGELYNKVIGG
jgi:hypothetical protein